MKNIIYVFAGACSYGVLSMFVKLAYDDGYDVNQVLGSQMLFGFTMFMLLRVFRSYPRLPVTAVLQLMGLGATTGLTGVFYYSALQTIPASIAIVLLFQFTWIGVLIESVLHRQRPSRAQMFALLLLILGTVLAGGVLGPGAGLSELALSGILFGLLSAVSYALFIVYSGKISASAPALQRSVLVSFGSLVTCFLIFPPTFLLDGSLFSGTLPMWGLLLGLFGPVIPILLFTKGVPHIGGSLASILSAAELPVAVITSWLVLKETVTPLQWSGTIIILIGVVLPEWLSYRSQAKRTSTDTL
ncbi:hypothetical protein SY83_06245 [Paenibacillus swuensis]|uniref:EamA domain-containing protein n=1 Tax=Paenibacillus swuensis TaxID=1178515 RepID=A0A172TGC5_9BACL|nr:DMT family transporter [Paenibacillus swuensis]ANE45954.1 hypothetical protein SY83_06245 [Paenibacillus swuensis]